MPNKSLSPILPIPAPLVRSPNFDSCLHLVYLHHRYGGIPLPMSEADFVAVMEFLQEARVPPEFAPGLRTQARINAALAFGDTVKDCLHDVPEPDIPETVADTGNTKEENPALDLTAIERLKETLGLVEKRLNSLEKTLSTKDSQTPSSNSAQSVSPAPHYPSGTTTLKAVPVGKAPPPLVLPERNDDLCPTEHPFCHTPVPRHHGSTPSLPATATGSHKSTTTTSSLPKASSIGLTPSLSKYTDPHKILTGPSHSSIELILSAANTPGVPPVPVYKTDVVTHFPELGDGALETLSSVTEKLVHIDGHMQSRLAALDKHLSKGDHLDSVRMYSELRAAIPKLPKLIQVTCNQCDQVNYSECTACTEAYDRITDLVNLREEIEKDLSLLVAAGDVTADKLKDEYSSLMHAEGKVWDALQPGCLSAHTKQLRDLAKRTEAQVHSHTRDVENRSHDPGMALQGEDEPPVLPMRTKFGAHVKTKSGSSSGTDASWVTSELL